MHWPALAGLAGELSPELSRVLRGEEAARVLSSFLRSRPTLSADQRRAVAEAFFGLALWRRRLAWHLGVDGPLLAASSHHLLFCLLRHLAQLPEADALTLAGLTAAPSSRTGAPDDLALRFSLPDWLARILTEAAGEEAPALADALNLPGPVTLRVNTLGISRDELARHLAAAGLDTRPGACAATALHIDTPRPNILGLPEHQAGLFEIQDEGSQLLGALVAARPGERVLDLCAGAGGKSLHLAAQLRNEGTLHVYDPDLAKLERLEQRARKAGIRCLHLHRAPPRPDLRVDRVLVDAPCSELGPLRRGPDVRFRLDPSRFAALPALQRSLLDQALTHLKPGGRFVYATCTFRREENEDVALAFEQAHQELRRIRPGDDWLDSILVTPENFFRALPHRHGTDGFFAAVWERRAP